MEAEVIIIGNELLKGRTQEANGYFAAKLLRQHGLTLQNISIIPDDPQLIHNTLSSTLAHNPQLLLIGGGLGPTQDDLTKNAVATFFAKPLMISKTAEQLIIEHYQRFNRTWEPNLNFYHHIPQDFSPLNNPTGLAPGLFYQSASTSIFLLPGVPHEFQSMLTQEVLPLFLQNNKPTNVLTPFSIRTVGIPEEKIFGELCPNLWDKLLEFSPTGISSLPNALGIDIVLQLPQNNLSLQEEIKTYMQTTPLASAIWHFGEEDITQLVVEKLRSTQSTISTAESCTGGLIAHMLTNIAGSSAIFPGSIVTYSNQSKQELVNVQATNLEHFGAVSANVAKEMARGIREKMHSTYGLSITGIAGPEGGSPEKPVGTVFIGLADKYMNESYHFQLVGNRLALKNKFAQTALFKLYQHLNQKDQL